MSEGSRTAKVSAGSTATTARVSLTGAAAGAGTEADADASGAGGWPRGDTALRDDFKCPCTACTPSVSEIVRSEPSTNSPGSRWRRRKLFSVSSTAGALKPWSLAHSFAASAVLNRSLLKMSVCVTMGALAARSASSSFSRADSVWSALRCMSAMGFDGTAQELPSKTQYSS